VQVHQRVEIFQLHVRQESRADDAGVVDESGYVLELSNDLLQSGEIGEIDLNVVDLQVRRLDVERGHLIALR